MPEHTKPIAETNRFIVLDKYTKEWLVCENGQELSERDTTWSGSLFSDLQNQGYEYLPDLNNPEAMLVNVRVQLQELK